MTLENIKKEPETIEQEFRAIQSTLGEEDKFTLYKESKPVVPKFEHPVNMIKRLNNKDKGVTNNGS